MMHVPTFDGRAYLFANYDEKAASRNQIPTLGPRKRATNLLLHMTGNARKVCISVGKDVIGDAGGVAHIPRILRERFAPDAIDCIFQDAAKFMSL